MEEEPEREIIDELNIDRTDEKFFNQPLKDWLDKIVEGHSFPVIVAIRLTEDLIQVRVLGEPKKE